MGIVTVSLIAVGVAGAGCYLHKGCRRWVGSKVKGKPGSGEPRCRMRSRAWMEGYLGGRKGVDRLRKSGRISSGDGDYVKYSNGKYFECTKR